MKSTCYNKTLSRNDESSVTFSDYNSVAKINKQTLSAFIYPTIPPKVFTDDANKEWLFFLAREDPINSRLTPISCYIYDVQNDRYVPFIKNYKHKFWTNIPRGVML